MDNLTACRKQMPFNNPHFIFSLEILLQFTNSSYQRAQLAPTLWCNWISERVCMFAHPRTLQYICVQTDQEMGLAPKILRWEY